MLVAKPIYSITPFTLLDYPDKTACILWFAGCNMRCVYCYNPDIVDGEGKLSVSEAINFLKKRVNLIDAVVLSGGECTRFKGLIELAKEIKKLGMLVKIDTNGSNPDLIKEIIEQKLVDYIALDFKTIEKNFFSVTGSKLHNRFVNTLDLLIEKKIAYEVRTTFHSELIGKQTILKMIDFLSFKKYKGNYFIQNYRNDSTTLGGIKNSEYRFNIENPDQNMIKIEIRN